MGRTPPKQIAAKKSAFLKALAKCGNVSQVSRDLGIPRRTHYDWIDDDPDYARDAEAAQQEYCDRLEAEADRRAVEGVEDPVYQGGQLVGKRRVYSDQLLITRLKALRPEVYKDRVAAEHTGKNGGPIQYDRVDLTKFTDEELEQLEELRRAANSRRNSAGEAPAG